MNVFFFQQNLKNCIQKDTVCCVFSDVSINGPGGIVKPETWLPADDATAFMSWVLIPG